MAHFWAIGRIGRAHPVCLPYFFDSAVAGFADYLLHVSMVLQFPAAYTQF
jgi:hypothetical protein